VVNLACSLGRPADHDRRRGELERAAERLGIASDVVAPPIAMSGSDDLDAAQGRLTSEIAERVARLMPDVVVSPSPHDLHHGHEVVGRAVRSALEAREHARWWQYAVWGDLPFPNVYVPLTPGDTERALYALGAYSGENERNDYRDLVSGGWVRGRALGAEKVFGFGARRPVEARAVELATEVIWDGARWRFGVARVFASDAALPAGSDDDATEWVRAQSVSALRPVPGPQPTAS